MTIREIQTTPTAYHLERDGRPLLLPRVTSVLSIVRGDLAAIPVDVLAHAAERGRAVHRAVWLLEAGGDGSGLSWDTLHPELAPYVRAYQAAKRALRFTVIEKERLVVSSIFGYAGRADLVVEWERRFGILDLKTGQEHASHHLQVSAYLEGWKEMTGSRKKVHRWKLYLRPTGGYDLDDCKRNRDGTPAPTHEADFRSFTNILGAYRWMQAHPNGNRRA